MDFLNIINIYFLYAAFVFNFILGAVVYLRNKKNVTNITFALLVFDLGLWSLSTGLLYTFPYLFWLNSVIVFFGFSLGFTLNLCAKNFPKPSKSSFIFYFYIISWELFVIVISIFGYHWLFPEYWVENGAPRIIFGLGYQIASVLVLPYVFSFFYLLYKNYKNSQRIARTQIKYLTLGMAIYLFVIVVLSVLLGSLNVEGFADLSPSFSIFLVGLATYAIVKHRLWDIRLVLVKSIIFSFIILSLASLYIFIIYFLKDYLSVIFGVSPNTTFVIAGLLIALGFAPFKRLVEKATDNIFFKGRYNPQKLLTLLTEEMKSTLDFDRLLDLVLNTLKKELKLSQIAFVLTGRKKILTLKTLGKYEDLNFKKYLKLLSDKDLLVTDELEDSKNKEILREQKIAVLLPLKMENKLLGFFILGEKLSGDMYSVQDLNFLELFASQAAIAINNAISYDEVVKDREKIKKLLTEKKGVGQDERGICRCCYS